MTAFRTPEHDVARSRRKIPRAIRHVQLRLLYPAEYLEYLATRERLGLHKTQPKETTR